MRQILLVYAACLIAILLGTIMGYVVGKGKADRWYAAHQTTHSVIESQSLQVPSDAPAIVLGKDGYSLYVAKKFWSISCIYINSETAVMRPNYDDKECFKVVQP